MAMVRSRACGRMLGAGAGYCRRRALSVIGESDVLRIDPDSVCEGDIVGAEGEAWLRGGKIRGDIGGGRGLSDGMWHPYRPLAGPLKGATDLMRYENSGSEEPLVEGTRIPPESEEREARSLQNFTGKQGSGCATMGGDTVGASKSL
jgi:hypothetical protein